MAGWLKLHRQILENPIVMKDSDHLAVWIYLLLNATHKEYPAIFKGEKITLQPGQLLTGRKAISDKLSIQESKVKRILTSFETDQQIDRQRGNKNSLISIVQWDKYQERDQQNDQQMTSKRPASDQQVTTNKNVKNIKNVKKSIYIPDLSEFSPLLQEGINEWITYKGERKEGYTDTGLKAWIGQIRNKAKTYEDKVIVDVIRRSMASQYKGVVWDWLKDAPKKQGKYKEYREEVKVVDTLSEKERAENMKKLQNTLSGIF